jgi:hypothetical protein
MSWFKLERYFEDIFNRIDKIHREETARIFLLAITAIRPFPVLSLHYLGMEATNKDYAIHMELSRISTQHVFRIKKKWKKLLNSRCRDLLEVDDPCNREDAPFLAGKVNLLHRTVGDFLRNNYSDELRGRAGEGFDARSSLCKTIIALSKVSADGNHPNISEGFDINIPNFDLVDEMLSYARDYERTEAQSVAVLLDELDRVNTIRTNGSHVHWVNKRVSSYIEYENCTFLALTIEAGLRIYVKEKLESNKMLITEKRGRPLLDYACRPSVHRRWPLDPEMVRLLLEHRSDPNQPVGDIVEGSTVWGHFVSECYSVQQLDGYLHDPLEIMQESMEFMIDHGADPTLKIKMGDFCSEERIKAFALGDGEKMLTMQEMLEYIFGPDRAAHLAARMEEYAQRNAPPPPPPPPSLFRRLLGWK